MKTPAQHQKNRTRKDVIARRMVTFFGIGVLATLLVMIWHLLSQTLPLFTTPYLSLENTVHMSQAQLVSAGNLSDNELLITDNNQCGLDFFKADDLNTVETRYLAKCSKTLLIAENKNKRWLFDIAQTGELSISSITPQGVYSLNRDNTALSVSFPDWQARPSYRVFVSEPFFAILADDSNKQVIFWGRFTSDTAQLYSTEIIPKIAGAGLIVLPAYQGKITYFENKFETQIGQKKPKQSDQLDKNIRAIIPLEENRSIFLASGEHLLSRWVLYNSNGRFSYTPTYTMELNSDETPIAVKAHGETNGAVMLTNQRRVVLFNRVSGEIFDSITLDTQPKTLSFIDDTVYLTYANKTDVLHLKNKAGIVTLNTLFKKQNYEGYQHKQHIYQTTTGSDFNEAKYALVPLFIGSIKAAMSALIIALPIALGAAIFTGYFAPNHWRNRIKSAIEMLEAVPSVMLGFIAAVFLIPIAEQLLIGIGLFIVTVPLLALGLAFLQNVYANRLPRPLRFSVQALLACLSVSVWAISCFSFAPEVMSVTTVFSGLTKTTLIVSIALGIAISPTIYTLAEDAIHSVPASLKNASFALGATKLQTLKNVVIRFAIPGLVAAVMLGFGRAIGETMIVLMITGNSPVPDWSLFESLRALTANIAIELTEAEVGSALYTVLFFTATSLFIFTFFFNTIAEGLRYKMRKQVNYV